ncbi:unnamed protein product (macronuclear) [Paramecium tetraurelia]|uniref:Uncharacterized protein n=1 Tax=Paramecium tetraurelia TaxID=5888 RepID=A0EB18_PARTE|nr:uncharacterized protein GSPATT00025219001 [Paramecium tetraurelia]CAK92485.1 unnamed protein product [Paramecium tetraurelia]|eukprot:XP_001459882.1 hypothetical protein (macronuclear) [Paramecium tetraurelia strain d4-2]
MMDPNIVGEKHYTVTNHSKISLLFWVWMNCLKMINLLLPELEKYKDSFLNHSSCLKSSQEERVNSFHLMTLFLDSEHYLMVKVMNTQKMHSICKVHLRMSLKKLKELQLKQQNEIQFNKIQHIKQEIQYKQQFGKSISFSLFVQYDYFEFVFFQENQITLQK